MADSLQHRGPDEEGYYIGEDERFGVNLGVRRLAIIDVKNGQQPPEGTEVKVVFNGEIYNHAEIRGELEREGIQFRSRCDTEVVARAWECWGMGCLSRLDGMFAFAAWDERDDHLYLVRDRVGKKPLFFYWEPDVNLLVFGSELKAILRNPWYTKAVSVQGIYDYLALQYVPEPRTAFRDVAALEPGNVITYEPLTGEFEKAQWYSLCAGSYADATDEELVGIVRDTVTAAVQKRLESDVSLGVYLSGGLDSSIVTALCAQERGTGNLHTFTMGFANPAYDERKYAALIAERYGTVHHEWIMEEPDIGAAARRIVMVYDQPFGDCSAIPTLRLAEESAKLGLTVALCGDGGDEGWCGYERYRAAKTNEGIYGYLPWLQIWRAPLIHKLMREDAIRQTRIYEPEEWLGLRASLFPGGRDILNQMGWTDTLTYLVGDIIVKMERATMAYGIEARCPFLDQKVLELAFAVPSRLKIHRTWSKWILLEAFGDRIPGKIRNRKKMGFGVPIGDWFRSGSGRECLRETLLGDESWIFDGDVVKGLTNQHLEGKAQLGHPLWVLMIAYLWFQRHFG